MISQTALATKLRRADNQPLARVLTLHNTSDIYKMSISLIVTRQQLAKVHQINASDGTWCPRAGLRFFVLSYFLRFFTHPTREYLHVIPRKSPEPKNIDLNPNPPKIGLAYVARKYQSTPTPPLGSHFFTSILQASFNERFSLARLKAPFNKRFSLARLKALFNKRFSLARLKVPFNKRFSLARLKAPFNKSFSLARLKIAQAVQDRRGL